jgi:hypothetical protein
MGDPGGQDRSSVRRRWWTFSKPNARRTPVWRFRTSSRGWRRSEACGCIAAPWSASCADRGEKKTLEVSGGSGEEAASIPTGEAFLAGGGAGQALYEARRAEFLARVRVSGEHPPGLGPQGLAGLLVPVEAGWMIRCYGVPRPAWSGWADPRAEALIAAYRLLSGAGLEGVMSPVPPSAEQEADDAGRRLRAGLH